MTSLPQNDFRAKRDYLPDHALALVEEGPDPPSDVISKQAWLGMIATTDDVVLRTTSFQGTLSEHCYDAWVAVVETLPHDRAEESASFEALLDLADHVAAASFSALHGFYRQAFATLRSSLELMIVTTKLALFDGLRSLREWRYEEEIPRIIRPTSDLDELARHTVVKLVNESMTTRSLAVGSGRGRAGWIHDTYTLLSKFTHVVPGYTDGELWRSNGPIWVPRAFGLYIESMREVLAISALLGRIADPDLQISGDLVELVTLGLEDWSADVRSALTALGVISPSA